MHAIWQQKSTLCVFAHKRHVSWICIKHTFTTHCVCVSLDLNIIFTTYRYCNTIDIVIVFYVSVLNFIRCLISASHNQWTVYVSEWTYNNSCVYMLTNVTTWWIGNFNVETRVLLLWLLEIVNLRRLCLSTFERMYILRYQNSIIVGVYVVSMLKNIWYWELCYIKRILNIEHQLIWCRYWKPIESFVFCILRTKHTCHVFSDRNCSNTNPATCCEQRHLAEDSACSFGNWIAMHACNFMMCLLVSFLWHWQWSNNVRNVI